MMRECLRVNWFKNNLKREAGRTKTFYRSEICDYKRMERVTKQPKEYKTASLYELMKTLDLAAESQTSLPVGSERASLTAAKDVPAEAVPLIFRATHSHLRWPDLSREWIRRQQARIARGTSLLVTLEIDAFRRTDRPLCVAHAVDWESRQPLILGPRKSRLNLFTRKQQKILKKAREMDGTPDLSALLKGKLQLLKKSSARTSPANPTGGSVSQGIGSSYPIEQTVDPSPPGSKPKKKSQKKKKSKETPSGGDRAATLEGSTDDSSLKKKKTKRAKRSREDLGDREDLDNDSSKGASGENPKKTKKSKKERHAEKAQQSPGLEEAPVVQGSPRVGEEVMECDSQENTPSEGALVRTESPGGPSVPPVKDRGTVPQRVSSSEGSLGKRPRIDFSDHVEFRYHEQTPLVCNPSQCAELSRQIRGSPREMPLVGDLFFKDDYIDVALAGRRADGCVNVLVEKYDTALKQTMGELGASTKLAKVRLGVIERLRADQERIAKKTLEEKEALRANAQLEKEKAELQAERDAVTQKLTEERRRLRDSRGQEVSRERVRVQSAMTDKLRRRLDSVRSYLVARDLFEKEKNLLGQASGTKKCLEMIREERLEITQELIDVFSQQEAEHQAAVAKLDVGPLPEEALALSPLTLRSRFVNEEFMATLDPYGSNEDLVGSESASQLRTPRTLPEDASVDRHGETPAEAILPEEESCPRIDEENAEEGRSLVREDPLSGVDPEKVVEIDDSSQGDEEEGAEETQSPIPAETGEPVEQEGLCGRNEDGMVPVDAPESQTVPEDVEATEELDAELHIAAEETRV
ncbi:hypothetical protein Bca52824_018277 [Brassica carinata]|uniref:Uncharacterized protein n=1 Tax=Brassica carinata TaxID=52824 RepID=A0A8X7VPT8_BRACI|nr:hypothetical protein Bca52824_018277 [Brassica carinata]